jgi:DNA polymerase elongation subunit (family B)
VVPGLGYHICTKRRGLIPRILEPVIARRGRYKRLAKEGGPRADIYKKRAVLLKWLLVTCFGYTGYKNSRFGKIECHESINAYGRETLLDAMEVAQDHGFTILHGIVDSLWLKGDPDKGPETAKAIAGRCGIPMEIEGVYKWIVFLHNKRNGIGALNRYYGVFEDGRVKVRGVEARRSDIPAFIFEFQNEALNALAKADDAEGFMRQIPECLELGRLAARKLIDGEVDPRALVFTKKVSMNLSDYRTTNDQASCLAVLKKHGIHVAPGQDVRFVITDASSRDPETRVVPGAFVGKGTRYDARAYTAHLARCLESLLIPFGWTEERVLGQICGPNWIPGDPYKGGMNLNLRPGALPSL